MADQVPQLSPEDRAKAIAIYNQIPKSGGFGFVQGEFHRALAKAGINPPGDGLVVTQTGDVVSNPALWKELLKAGAIVGGAGLAGAAIGGAFGSGGAAASTAPVAGSAFGAPAGAIGGLGGIGSGVSAGTAAGVAGTAGAGAAAPSLLSRIGGVASRLSPILGQAAGSRAAAQGINDQNALGQAQLDLQQQQYKLNEPGQRLHTAMDASRIAHASPVSAQWNGPGSGLRGETVKFSGGYANPDLVDPRVKSQADSTMQQEMEAQLSGGTKFNPLQKPGHSSLLDNLLGYGATGLGILGGIKPQRPRAY